MKTKISSIVLLASLTIMAACTNEIKKDDTPQKEEPKEVTADENKYEQIKTDYELLGAWIIKNSFTKSSYDYEIYSKKNEFVGVSKLGGLKFEILKKDGDMYIVDGNEYGEYYKVDSDNNLTLFDQDGELTGSGYKATKK